MKRIKTFVGTVAAVASVGMLCGWLCAQQPGQMAPRSGGVVYSSDSNGIAYDIPGFGNLNDQGEEQLLNSEIDRLMLDYKKTDSENAKNELTSKLNRVIAKLFEVKQKIRQQELKKLEDQLAKLKELHEKRENQKASIVNDRVTQLIREADGLGWGTSDVNRVWTGPGNVYSTSGQSGLGYGGNLFGSPGPAQASGGYGVMGGGIGGSMGGGMSGPSSAAATSPATTGARAPRTTSGSLQENEDRLLEWARKSMAKNDKDNDNSLDASEYSGDFEKADTNKDGKIDVEEYVKSRSSPVRK